jgi:hypothetical protein
MARDRALRNELEKAGIISESRSGSIWGELDAEDVIRAIRRLRRDTDLILQQLGLEVDTEPRLKASKKVEQ